MMELLEDRTVSSSMRCPMPLLSPRCPTPRLIKLPNRLSQPLTPPMRRSRTARHASRGSALCHGWICAGGNACGRRCSWKLDDTAASESDWRCPSYRDRARLDRPSSAGGVGIPAVGPDVWTAAVQCFLGLPVDIGWSSGSDSWSVTGRRSCGELEPAELVVGDVARGLTCEGRRVAFGQHFAPRCFFDNSSATGWEFRGMRPTRPVSASYGC